MSDNPAAFDALRRAAYDFVNHHGKDPVALEAACLTFVRVRKVEDSIFRNMSENEMRRLVGDIVRWTVKRYNPPKRKPERHREERAAAVLLAPSALEVSGELYGKATVRNAARLSGQSKSTMARHLISQGIAPRRDRKISQLPPNAQKLVRILDETFARRAEGVMKMADLIDAVWGRSTTPPPRTTLASRRKAMTQILTAVRNSNVGYHTLTRGDLIAVRRGRKFKSLSDATIWMDDVTRSGNFTRVQIPDSVVTSRFWDDPYIGHMLELLDMCVTRHFYPLERLKSIFFFGQPLLDMTPLLYWLEKAHWCYHSTSIGENLAYLSDKIHDRGVREAAGKVSTVLQQLARYIGPLQPCCDAFAMIDFVLCVLDHARHHAPDSFCRLSWLHVWLSDRSDKTFPELQDGLCCMLALEKSGEWQAPTAEELRAFLTVADNPN